jgi:lipopolysaccharide transport system ATP-binding protein
MPAAALPTMSDAGPAIEVRGLTKRYPAARGSWDRLRHLLLAEPPRGQREFVALDGVCLTVPRGSALGVIGPNGAGKSTLLKILAGIVQPTAGEVRIAGSVASIIELGTGFHPEFTGRENVFMNARLMGFPPGHAQAVYDEIAAFCELGRYMDMPVKTYSSGMFVRLAFATAISARPDVLLVDEALAVGDAVFAHRCLGRIREMREAGVTIVFVSHDTNMVAQVCDRAVLLDRGRIAAEGPPRDVVHAYLLRVAERLTTTGQPAGRLPARFHEIGAVEAGAEVQERRFGTFEARITHISIGDAKPGEVPRLAPGHTAAFRMTVRFDAAVQEPVFGVMIRNRAGLEVFGTNTHLRKISTGTFQPREAAEITFDMPMHLTGGTYTASFAVHTADGHYFDYRTDARVFEVADTPEAGGVANLPVSVSISRREASAAVSDHFTETLYPEAPSALDMGPDAEPYLAGDWYAAEHQAGRSYRWTGRHASVFLRRPASGKARLIVEMRNLHPRGDAEPVTVEVSEDQHRHGAVQLRHHEWQRFEFPVHGDAGRVAKVTLTPSAVWIPREYAPDSADTRELGVMVRRIEMAAP